MSTLYRAAAALVLSLLGACRLFGPGGGEPELSFEIRAPHADDPCVRLTLRTQAAGDGRCALEQKGSWAGTEDSSVDLKEVRAQGADGRELALESPGHGKWNLQAHPGEALRVTWSIPKNEFLQSGVHQDHYRAALTDELFHAIGFHLWIAPVALATTDDPVRITLDWRDFDELGWSCVSSFGTGTHLVLERPLDEFRGAVFLAGRYVLRERSIRGRRLVVALPEQGFSGADDSFVDLCARIVAAQRAFFDDWDYPFYLISAVPTLPPDPHSNSLGGTGLIDSFALFLQRGTDLGPQAEIRPQILHVLAHEMFHNWCGRGTPVREPEELTYWFSEGFTDFFTRRLLLRAGLTTREEYAASLELRLREYLQSPRRNCSNEDIRTGFWKDPETNEMPYRRGDLVAARLDCAIRARSGGRQSLDDFLREAVELGRRRQELDVETLLARIERWTDARLARELRAVVVEGATLELPSDTFAPCLAIEPESVPRYELGFDLEATSKTGVITGLVPGSAAERAGLAEGQKLSAFADMRRARQPVHVTVIVDGARKDISYLPQGPAELLPHVRVAAEAGCSIL
jgi:predicted metalloprotease with PDZ domain